MFWLGTLTCREWKLFLGTVSAQLSDQIDGYHEYSRSPELDGSKWSGIG